MVEMWQVVIGLTISGVVGIALGYLLGRSDGWVHGWNAGVAYLKERARRRKATRMRIQQIAIKCLK